MAARQQLPNCRVKVKSMATDSKAGNETHVGLDMRTTEDDWARLGKMIKTGGVTISVVTFAPSEAVNQQKLIFGENHAKVKNATKEVQRVLFIAGKDENPMAIGSVRDIGLIKCLSVMYEIPNPLLYNLALDGFECPFDDETFDFKSKKSVKPVKSKSKEATALEINVFNLSMMDIGPCSRAKYKATEKRLMTAVKQLTARQDADARMKAKAAEKLSFREKAEATEKSDEKLKSKAAEASDSSNSATTIEESDSRKTAKAIDDSNSKMESKVANGSEHRKKPDAVKESDSRKVTKAEEKSNTNQELKSTERKTRSGKDVMMDESEVEKATYDQGMTSSRPVIKRVRTCMNCGQQEPEPKVFKKCRRCKDEGYPDPPYYCGRDCQVLDWTARHRQQHEKNNAGDPHTS